MTRQLRVNPVACSGHGLCAELLPELITLDEWGYPLLADQRVPGRLERHARRAVTACPALALLLAEPPGAFRENSEPAHRDRAGQGPIRTP
jgi:ferredoxin